MDIIDYSLKRVIFKGYCKNVICYTHEICSKTKNKNINPSLFKFKNTMKHLSITLVLERRWMVSIFTHEMLFTVIAVVEL